MTAKSAADAGTIRSITEQGPIIFAIRKLSGLGMNCTSRRKPNSGSRKSRYLNYHNSKNPSIWPSFIYCQRETRDSIRRPLSETNAKSSCGCFRPSAASATGCHGLLAGAGSLLGGSRRPRLLRSVVLGWPSAARRCIFVIRFLWREADIAGADGFATATQISPFTASPALHSSGQTRSA